MDNAERELRNIENNKLQFQYRASVSKWIQVRDQVNKNFFYQVARKQSALAIKKLRRHDGCLVKDKSKMLQIATTYYNNLLSIGVLTHLVHTSKK